MIYIERRPHPALAPYIRCYWYAHDPHAEHGRERVLPVGSMQVVMSLARDYLTDCTSGQIDCNSGVECHSQPSAPALLIGMRLKYDVIDRYDMAELMGVSFRTGGTAPFFDCSASAFTELQLPLEDVWGSRAKALRERLRETNTVGAKFAMLESEYLLRLEQSRRREKPGAVTFALSALRRRDDRMTVLEIGRHAGLSTRRLTELFREHVGLSPKSYQRILRFQRAVQQMHRGTDVRWMELALECGYYDQSHFVNDFREFSGISPTTYASSQRIWSNHVPCD